MASGMSKTVAQHQAARVAAGLLGLPAPQPEREHSGAAARARWAHTFASPSICRTAPWSESGLSTQTKAHVTALLRN